MMDNKKLFDECIKIMNYKSEEAAEIMLLSPDEFIMIPENLSSDMVGKRIYNEFLKLYEEEWNDRIKSHGKYSFIHFDGYLKGILKDVSNAGFLVIEVMTPKPVGDLEVNEFSKYTSNNSVMWGGLPVSIFIKSFSEEEFEKFVLKNYKNNDRGTKICFWYSRSDTT